MVIKTKNGFFKVLTNIKEAWNKEEFELKYLEEFFNDDRYILGDISSSKLRLKGFGKDDNNKQTLEIIDKYIDNDCAFHCPYYIVRRLTENEYILNFESEKNVEPYGTDLDIDKIYEKEKVPFDYDSLILDFNPSVKANIKLEMQRINKVVTFELPEDLKNIISHSNKKGNNSKRKDSSSIKSNEAKKERSKKAANKNSENINSNKKQKKNHPKKKNPNNQNLKQQANSNKQNPNKQNQNRPNPNKQNPNKTNPNKQNPNKPNPNKQNPNKPNPNKQKQNKPNPNKPNPNKQNPNKPNLNKENSNKNNSSNQQNQNKEQKIDNIKVNK